MNLGEYASYDAIGLMDLVRKGQVSPAELRQCAVQAIERTHPVLNLLASALNEQADWLPDRPFSGLPFLLKEGHGWRGGALTMGSRLGAGLQAQKDSELTLRLRGAGVDILGETTTPEFGSSAVTESSLHGETRNPWNLGHSPGGSSGGASAAVAAGVVPVAQSSDGGGSIRGPAHCCGIYGLKPSRWRTPEPLSGLFGFGHFHVSTRTVRDSAAFLDVQQGYFAGSPAVLANPERPYQDWVRRTPRTLRIAVTRQSPGTTPVSAECLQAIDRAIALAESLGHVVEETAPAIAWEPLIKSFIVAWFHAMPLRLTQCGELSGREPGPETLDAMTWKSLQYAKTITVDDLVVADSVFRMARIAVGTFLERYDMWLTPTGVSQAPLIGQFDPRKDEEALLPFVMRMLNDYAIFTPLLNITGHPAASVPLHHGANGLPAGVQLIGPMGDDATVLQLSAQFEAADPWIQRHPPVSVFDDSMSQPSGR